MELLSGQNGSDHHRLPAQDGVAVAIEARGVEAIAFDLQVGGVAENDKPMVETHLFLRNAFGALDGEL